ncbi:unnamed protein product [Effrenium voratum]|nr:unnamed protein product [Effrenium voratum]
MLSAPCLEKSRDFPLNVSTESQLISEALRALLRTRAVLQAIGYGYSGAKKDPDAPKDDFQGLCGLDPASTRRLSGYGFGLPLSRVYARYFGGDIHVQSMHGYGTDVYLNVNHLGDALENDGTAKRRRVWVAS